MPHALQEAVLLWKGTLSTLALAPLPASNGVGDLPRQLRFARNTSGIAGLRLVPGTVTFDPMP